MTMRKPNIFLKFELFSQMLNCCKTLGKAKVHDLLYYPCIHCLFATMVCLFDRNQLLSCEVRKVYGAWLVIDAFLPSGNFIKARTPLLLHTYTSMCAPLYCHLCAHLSTAGWYCKQPNTMCLGCIDCTWTFLPLGPFRSTTQCMVFPKHCWAFSASYF